MFYENHLCTENREFISFLDRLRPIETNWSYNGIEISGSLFKESSDFVFGLSYFCSELSDFYQSKTMIPDFHLDSAFQKIEAERNLN